MRFFAGIDFVGRSHRAVFGGANRHSSQNQRNGKQPEPTRKNGARARRLVCGNIGKNADERIGRTLKTHPTVTAKIIKGTSFSGAIGYMLSKKEKAEILKAEGVRIEPKELSAKCFELQASMHPNVKKPVWHISLNFSEKDKDKLTNEKMVEIAEAYLQKMNIRNTQYLIVRHRDREHPHIHLCINRIDNDGKLISDKNEKFRSTAVCKELTQKYGLYFATGKENVNRERLIGYDKTKYEIFDALQHAIPKSKTWSELEKQLKKNGITFQFKTSGKTDKIQGIIFEKDGIKINGSKVDRNCSFSKIDRQIKENAYHALQETERQAQQANSAESVVETLSSLIQDFSPFTLPNSPHYDATLADYILALKAKKRQAQSKMRIRRIR